MRLTHWLAHWHPSCDQPVLETDRPCDEEQYKQAHQVIHGPERIPDSIFEGDVAQKDTHEKSRRGNISRS
jgi:hypothetical protein